MQAFSKVILLVLNSHHKIIQMIKTQLRAKNGAISNSMEILLLNLKDSFWVLQQFINGELNSKIVRKNQM